MPRFQHVDPTGRLQFWTGDREHVIDAEPVEVSDPQAVAYLDACPFVKRATVKTKREEEV